MMRYQVIRGLPFPNVEWFTKKNIEEALDYVPHDGDMIIASYPKTGTTWLQYIVIQIVSKGETFPSFDDSLHKFAPFMEMVGTSGLDDMPQPRIYKHHIPYNMLKKNPKAKTLYIYRRPEDTCVSYYHFVRKLRPECDTLDQFFELFVTGDISYGHYFQNLVSYLEQRNDENLLIVSYEKLKKNTKAEILRVAEFLGEEYHRELMADDSLLERIMEHTSFDYMKKNLSLTHPGAKEDPEGGPKEKVDFFRKGVVGDGKNVFSADQLERLQSVAKEMLKDYDFVLKEWYGE